MLLILTAGLYFVVESKKSSVVATAGAVQTSAEIIPSVLPTPVPAKKLSNPPEIIKAVYMTGYSASSKSYLNYLSNLFKSTEINAVVVDIKGSDGRVLKNMVPGIDGFVNFFHDKNIYVIGRIAVFEDPEFAKARPDLAVYNKAETTDTSKPVLWYDRNGLAWMDPSSKDVWDYDVSLAKDAIFHGFDEINFDYVRFPTDGKTENMEFPFYKGKIAKSDVIKEFFQYLRSQLADEKISIDLFGLTTVNADDMGIGQLLENAFENFDYICPMVYPSHYANGFIGFANPAEHPYEVIKYSMDKALNRELIYSQIQESIILKSSLDAPATLVQVVSPSAGYEKLAKFRPWLQDFNMGADYTSDMVKQEIKATQDSLGKDYNGFMLWNPNNIYTKDALATY